MDGVADWFDIGATVLDYRDLKVGFNKNLFTAWQSSDLSRPDQCFVMRYYHLLHSRMVYCMFGFILG